MDRGGRVFAGDPNPRGLGEGGVGWRGGWRGLGFSVLRKLAPERLDF